MTAPSNGLVMFSVSAVTIAVKAAPMMTATARSITLPRRMKSRNPLSMSESPGKDLIVHGAYGERPTGNVVITACSGAGSITQREWIIAWPFDEGNRGWGGATAEGWERWRLRGRVRCRSGWTCLLRTAWWGV